jgi:hypothetical protein
MAMSVSHVVSSAAAVRPTPATAAAARRVSSVPSAAVGGVGVSRSVLRSSRSSRSSRRATSVVAMAAAEPTEKKKLWGGRFSEDIDPLMEKFNESLSFDRRMAQVGLRSLPGVNRLVMLAAR